MHNYDNANLIWVEGLHDLNKRNSNLVSICGLDLLFLEREVLGEVCFIFFLL
jgi:hypothetical protein